MKCVICRHGETHPGTATVVLEHGGATLVIKSVPALVCTNCGEEYVQEDTAARLLSEVERASQAGIQVEIRQFAAA